MSGKNTTLAAFESDGLITIANFLRACGSYMEMKDLVSELTVRDNHADSTGAIAYTILIYLPENSAQWKGELHVLIPNKEEAREIEKELSEPMALTLQQNLEKFRLKMENISMSIWQLEALAGESEGLISGST